MIAAAIVIGVVGTCLLLLRWAGQPRYKGKTLSQWLDQGEPLWAVSNRVSPEQEVAIKKMGPKALPYLLEWLDDEPWLNSRRLMKILNSSPAWFKTSRWPGRLMQKAQDNELHSEFRAAASANALRILGPGARPAIPALIRIFRAQRHWYSTYRVGEVLANHGADSLPGLLNMLSDPSFSNHLAVVQVIGRMHDLGPAGVPAIPILCGYLESSDARLCVASVEALATLRLCPEKSVPVLVHSLTKAIESSDLTLARKSAEALAQFGESASNAVPALCDALKVPDGITTEEAARALGRIGADSEMAVPALIAYFKGNDKRHRKYAVEGLKGYGVAAREAAPLLREALSDEDHDTRALAADLLQSLSAGQ
jgi:HEAT repeat protein